ncbi:TetR/AcrR family transcriptional regulator [Inquilinus limosus]|uniref:TetR/AcrR family transcriptional regulator n=1 Tax=Inquilinus limosus TaxID=171674 RepID=UPI00069043DF|nr:TetR/AcrR family transcriptional regulator [Inquilinus limosus]
MRSKTPAADGPAASSDGPKTRRSPKGQRRRQQILDAAMEMFAQGGYAGTAIASIAEKAGLTLPGLLHHFPSKMSLLLAAMEERDHETGRLLAAEETEGRDPGTGRLLSPDGLTWRRVLDDARRVVRHNAGKRNLVQVFAILNGESLIENHPAQAFFRRRSAYLLAFMRAAFQAGIDAGELRPDLDPQLLAYELIAMMDGLQIQWLRDPDGVDMAAGFEAYLGRLEAGIRARATGDD